MSTPHRYRFARVRRDQSKGDTKPVKARIGIAEAAPAAAVASEEGAKAIDLRAAQARRPTTPHVPIPCPCAMCLSPHVTAAMAAHVSHAM